MYDMTKNKRFYNIFCFLIKANIGKYESTAYGLHIIRFLNEIVCQ